MSRRQMPHHPQNPLALKLETLDDDVELANYINRLLSADSHSVNKLIDKTSRSGYRRVHDHLADTLDKLISTFDKLISRPEVGSGELKGSLLGLSKTLILVEYQLARKQISDDLANTLKDIIRKLMSDISKALESKEPTRFIEELKKLKEEVERARTIIDCLAVLVYREKR